MSGPVPFALRKIDHVVLRVADREKSLAFYCDVLGCPVDHVQDKIGLYQVRAGDSLIDLIPLNEPLGRLGGAGPAVEGRNVDHFALQVTPFDEQAIRAHLAAHAVEITSAGERYAPKAWVPPSTSRTPTATSLS